MDSTELRDHVTVCDQCADLDCGLCDEGYELFMAYLEGQS